MNEAKLAQNLGTHGLMMKYLIMIMVARTVAIDYGIVKTAEKGFRGVWGC
jgi:hypothetical protein